MRFDRSLIGRVDRKFPRTQASFDDLQNAFGSLLGQYGRCASVVSRYIGGEYVSRDRRGDSHAQMPLNPVPKADEIRAFKVLESNLFSAQAWDFSPSLLREAVTQYRYDDWDGNLVPRHDIPVEAVAERYQRNVLARMFTPITLQRLDDMHSKYGKGTTMDLADLFTWMQSAVYSDVSHPKGGTIPLVRRNLQRDYASLLSRLANSPVVGEPQDAQALARYELSALHSQLGRSLAGSNLDLMTRAHLASLDTDVERALHAQAVIGEVKPAH
jgi:hypothetical protein